MSVFAMSREYLETLEQDYKRDPQSLPPQWRAYFTEFFGGEIGGEGLGSIDPLLHAFRDCGHYEATTNPLAPLRERPTPSPTLVDHPLTLEKFGLSAQTLVHYQDRILPAGEIVAHLRRAYCGTLSIQISNSSDANSKEMDWWIREFEKERFSWRLSPLEKVKLFESLTRVEVLEKLIHTKYVGTKRFSIEGVDSLLPMLEFCSKKTVFLEDLGLGFEELIIGMTHRGRLNILANFMGKDLRVIFEDFNTNAVSDGEKQRSGSGRGPGRVRGGEGSSEAGDLLGDFNGDVKYHLGYEAFRSRDACKVILAFNPSHLEAVNPVVLGMTRAAQRRLKDTERRKRVIPILIHGDASFAGQGVVAEIFQMSQVRGYTVGGTLHIVLDNQIGFTTDPMDGRSSYYCTDVARAIGAPVLHINADDPEACIQGMDMALRYRQIWGKDIVLNLVGYRRHGHNEGDEPAYTQPVMYRQIRSHPPVREIYLTRLLEEKVLTQEEASEIYSESMERVQKKYTQAQGQVPNQDQQDEQNEQEEDQNQISTCGQIPLGSFKFDGFWEGFRRGEPGDFEHTWDTTFSLSTLQKIGQHLGRVPDHFSLDPKLEKLLDRRRRMAQGEEPVDWGMAELLAYGSLLEDKFSLRITGQDCVRGTFSHRHMAFYDSQTGEPYFPLKHWNERECCVYNSILSEYGVLGFEYGNAVCDPTFLTIWEAQFGDFANGAQVLIDQFISSGESKWHQMCGLVLLLPHGYEGQGPEHSSARLERFLQMCAQHNMQVMNLTTPAQIFHALRRQMKRPFRKPLIIMSPKSLLRHPKATSSLEDLAQGRFQELIIGDPQPLKEREQRESEIRNLILCTGKIYYEIIEFLNEKENEGGKGFDGTSRSSWSVARLEQVYPTPLKDLEKWIRSHPRREKIIWVQEEPRNMGAYAFIQEQLGRASIPFCYVGRPEKSSPAVGSLAQHRREQRKLLDDLAETLGI